MAKKATWKSEIPGVIVAGYAVYFGFSGGIYPWAEDRALYHILAVALGLANIVLIITTLMLMRSMKKHEKYAAKLQAFLGTSS